MKFLFLIITPLLLFSIGCAKEEEDIKDNIDRRLFGVWMLESSSSTKYFRSFSQNEKSAYWREISAGVPDNEAHFDWYVEDGYLILYREDGSEDVISYGLNFNERQLRLNTGIWNKQ